MEKTKKNRVIAIAAIGALAILLASTAVRCAASGTVAQEAYDAPAQEASEQQEGAAEAESSAVSSDSSQESALEACQAASWAAADGSGAKLQLVDHMAVEQGEDGSVSVLSFTGSTESGEGDQVLVRLFLEDGGEAVLIVSRDSDGAPQEVSCDSFEKAGKYVAKATSDESGSEAGGADFEVTGLDESYLALVGGDSTALEEAIGSYVTKSSPQATKAFYDGEVYLDTKEDTVTASFHLNDPAKSIITATWADGAFTVAG